MKIRDWEHEIQSDLEKKKEKKKIRNTYSEVVAHKHSLKIAILKYFAKSTIKNQQRSSFLK